MSKFSREEQDDIMMAAVMITAAKSTGGKPNVANAFDIAEELVAERIKRYGRRGNPDREDD